jgi:hypothetical protein
MGNWLLARMSLARVIPPRARVWGPSRGPFDHTGARICERPGSRFERLEEPLVCIGKCAGTWKGTRSQARRGARRKDRPQGWRPAGSAPIDSRPWDLDRGCEPSAGPGSWWSIQTTEGLRGSESGRLASREKKHPGRNRQDLQHDIFRLEARTQASRPTESRTRSRARCRCSG